jgi:tetratricopeptide (TPR) repeat protein
MKTKTTAVLAVALFSALIAEQPARATESFTNLGIEPSVACAEGAAVAAEAGKVSTNGMAACNDAIRENGVPLSEQAVNYLNRSAINLAAGDYAAAIVDDTAALRLVAAFPEALINRAAAFSSQGQQAAAVADLNHALDLSPAHPERIYYNRGLAREDLGDIKGAYLDYCQAAQLAPTWQLPKTELARFTVTRAAQG